MAGRRPGHHSSLIGEACESGEDIAGQSKGKQGGKDRGESVRVGRAGGNVGQRDPARICHGAYHRGSERWTPAFWARAGGDPVGRGDHEMMTGREWLTRRSSISPMWRGREGARVISEEEKANSAGQESVGASVRGCAVSVM
jgi:hypothetical protein